MNDKILVINPGSTSTKVALFQGEKQVFKQTVPHDMHILKQFPNATDQIDYRKETILKALEDASIDISDCAAFSGRGGGLAPCKGGVYEINDAILKDARSGKYADHPACLGNLISYDFAKKYHARAFTVNPPSTDEFQDVARVYLSKTGGFVDHLGSSETLEIIKRIKNGDQYAKLIYDAFQYQVAKQIGAMAVVLNGKVDAIILTGGIANDEELTANLTEMVGFLAPVVVRAGEFEMEALAAGALRVLRGEEESLVYTGQPVFTNFEHLKTNA